MKHDKKIWILIVMNVFTASVVAFTALAVLRNYRALDWVEDRLLEQRDRLHDMARSDTYIWHRVKGFPIRDVGPDEGTEIFWYDSDETEKIKKQRLENKLSRK